MSSKVLYLKAEQNAEVMPPFTVLTVASLPR